MATRLTIIMPDDLHKRLKMTAVERDTTMTDLLIDCAKKLTAQPDRTQETRGVYDIRKQD